MKREQLFIQLLEGLQESRKQNYSFCVLVRIFNLSIESLNRLYKMRFLLLNGVTEDDRLGK